MSQQATRTEKDFIGSMQIPADALFGIHSQRARQNFPDQTVFHKEWYMALGLVKKACYLTANEFFKKVGERGDLNALKTTIIDSEVLSGLIDSAAEINSGKHFEYFITPAISGGAGTSINLNVNEVIANRCLQILGHNPGEYNLVDPIEHANIFQSTNDVVPTSLKLTVIQLLTELEDEVNQLRQQFEQLEKKYQYTLRAAYTQMQEAVPTSYGKLFGTYSEALSRDWWRISKCFERIKVVNLGGSAIGSGITVPRFYLMEVVRTLQELSGLPITRGENLYDATNNLDPFVEVHGILKSLAVNFEKIMGDIRLLASDLHVSGELKIPQKQVGSSIMPGKVNPVIPEFVISSSHKVYANDMLLSGLCAQGCLELNAYIPTIGHALIESLKLLKASAVTMRENALLNLNIDQKQANNNIYKSPSITTALVPFIGYNKAAEMAQKMKTEGKTIFEVNDELKGVKGSKLKDILKPDNLLKEGFTMNDLTGE